MAGNGEQHLLPKLRRRAGPVLRYACLVLMVCTYSGCPLMVSWSKVIGSETEGTHEVPIKGRPFKEASVIVMNWFIVGCAGLMISFYMGGWSEVKQCFDVRAILRFAPAGFGWALADVSEVLAVARIDPATYGVISQARLLSAALVSRLLRGMRQSTLQWGILMSLSLICMAYCLVPDASEPNRVRLKRWKLNLGRAEFSFRWHPAETAETPQEASSSADRDFLLGVIFALSKVALSVWSGVYGELHFKAPSKGPEKPVGLHVQMTQISCSGLIAAIIGYWVICMVQEEDPRDFFVGPDGEWDYRTWVVAFLYAWREWLSNIVVKHFDSVVKNICNAVALIGTYIITVVVTEEKPFSILKAMILFAVVIEVLNYATTKMASQASAGGASTATENGKSMSLGRNGISELPVDEYKAMGSKAVQMTHTE